MFGGNGQQNPLWCWATEPPNQLNAWRVDDISICADSDDVRAHLCMTNMQHVLFQQFMLH